MEETSPPEAKRRRSIYSSEAQAWNLLNSCLKHDETFLRELNSRRTRTNNGIFPVIIEMAIELRNTEALCTLLVNGLDANATDRVNRSLLLIAASQRYTSSYPRVIELLLNNGATPEAKALEAVITKGCIPSVQSFIDQGVLRIKSLIPSHPLVLSVQNPHSNVLKYLLDLGFFSLEESDSKGRTALHVATELGNLKAIKVLLERGADVNSIDEGGLTPLHLVVLRSKKKNMHKCAELLLEHGADLSVKSILSGRTALDVAVDLCKNSPWEFDFTPSPLLQIVMQINILKSQGKEVISSGWYRMKEINNRCMNELEAMKNNFIVDTVSLYDVLITEVPELRQILLKNLKNEVDVQSILERFPIYGTKLESIITSAGGTKMIKKVNLKKSRRTI